MGKKSICLAFISLAIFLGGCTSAKNTVSTVSVETAHGSTVIVKKDTSQNSSSVKTVAEAVHIDSVAYTTATQGDSMEELTEWERITERFDTISGTRITERAWKLLRRCHHASQSHGTATHDSQNGDKVIQSATDSAVASSIALIDSAKEKFFSLDSVNIQRTSGKGMIRQSVKCAILVCTMIAFCLLLFFLRKKKK